MKERFLYAVSVDEKGFLHQRCELKTRGEALEMLKQLGTAVAKISSDLVDDVKRKGS